MTAQALAADALDATGIGLSGFRAGPGKRAGFTAWMYR